MKEQKAADKATSRGDNAEIGHVYELSGHSACDFHYNLFKALIEEIKMCKL
jgi:hypothetical protein